MYTDLVVRWKIENKMQRGHVFHLKRALVGPEPVTATQLTIHQLPRL
jgi:hypothetical protein